MVEAQPPVLLEVKSMFLQFNGAFKRSLITPILHQIFQWKSLQLFVTKVDPLEIAFLALCVQPAAKTLGFSFLWPLHRLEPLEPL